MRRSARPPRHDHRSLALATFAVLVALLLAPAAVFAHHGADGVDPECALRFPEGAPAGMTMAQLCPAETMTTSGTVTEGEESLLPLIAAAVVCGIVLLVVGVGASLTSGGRRGATWWACAACGAMNSGTRSRCFTCQAPGRPVARRSGAGS